MQIIVYAIMLSSSGTAESIGPQPTMEEFAVLAEQAVASKLVEPTSATFKWPYQLVAGPIGYYTCGLLRSRNSKGGSYEIWVSAVVANGRVVNSQSAESNGMLAYDCKKQVKKGKLVDK